ncbi:hypothetical protein AB1Y20_014799 [Prymnesium parvum]|uniref:Uncharacterized protein n=1 Tax=Prymnesium parvum TaxID=97485 RepID=A0AB34IDY5_PRYPA
MLAEIEATISLRFGVGTRVECNCGEWKEGTVVKHYYAQKSFAPGTCMPYLIRLTDGKYIFAPRDVDDVIRLPINIQLITPSETEMPAEVVGPDFGGSGNAAHDR